MPDDASVLGRILPDQLETLVIFPYPCSPDRDRQRHAERQVKKFYHKRPWLKPKPRDFWFEMVGG